MILSSSDCWSFIYWSSLSREQCHRLSSSPLPPSLIGLLGRRGGGQSDWIPTLLSESLHSLERHQPTAGFSRSALSMRSRLPVLVTAPCCCVHCSLITSLDWQHWKPVAPDAPAKSARPGSEGRNDLPMCTALYRKGSQVNKGGLKGRCWHLNIFYLIARGALRIFFFRLHNPFNITWQHRAVRE